MPSPEEQLRIPAKRLAAAARALQPTLLRLIAARSDRISAALEVECGMVPWDREQLIGQLQRQLLELSEARFVVRGGPPVHVTERRTQPLEAVPCAWRWLREGRIVYVDAAPGACGEALSLLSEMGEILGFGVLSIARERHVSPDSAVDGGVEPARSRVAFVSTDADEELAAYVLARACLRRSGVDPRALHIAIVCGGGEKLVRMLRRLWYSVRFSDAGDHGAFAGPIPEDLAATHASAMDLMRRRVDMRCLVPHRPLEGAPETRGRLVAPSLWLTTPGLTLAQMREAAAAFPSVGPSLLVIPTADPTTARDLLAWELAEGCRWTLIGPGPARRWARVEAPPVRVFDGALLEDRLPPGLPKPRP